MKSALSDYLSQLMSLFIAVAGVLQGVVMWELQVSVGDNSGDQSVTYTSLVNDVMLSSLAYDVRVGRQRLIQVFITHSANVFLVDHPPITHATSRELISEHLLRLEDQVRCGAGPDVRNCRV